MDVPPNAPARSGQVPGALEAAFAEHGSACCFMVFSFFKSREEIQFRAAGEGQFVFASGRFVYLKGCDIRVVGGLLSDIDLPPEVELTFSSGLRPLVEREFSGFRVEGSPGRAFREFHALALARPPAGAGALASPRLECGVRVQKIYRQEGLSYILTDHGEVACVVPVPYILVDGDYSFAVVRGLETKPSFRRRGYARATLETALVDLFHGPPPSPRVDRVFLWVEVDNLPAVKLYEGLGFRVDGNWVGTTCVPKTA
ncbi:MAG: GNAT family N-acetyltransferase [Promethearchaeota archaeon]